MVTPAQPLASHPNARWQTSFSRSCARPSSLPLHPLSYRKMVKNQHNSTSGCRLQAVVLSPAFPDFSPSCVGLRGEMLEKRGPGLLVPNSQAAISNE